MNIENQLVKWFVKANQAVIILAMASIALLVMANVVSRYLFGSSLSWTEELSRFLMIGVTYLGAGLALREGRLVAVDWLQDKLSSMTLYIRLIVAAVMLSLLGALSILGFQYAIFAAGQETPVLGVSAMIPYLIIPVGSLLMALHLLSMLKDFLGRHWKGDIEDIDVSITHPKESDRES